MAGRCARQWRADRGAGSYLEWMFPAQQPQEQEFMDKANKTKPRDPMREIVFGGGPPPPLPKPAPVPEVRRDSMGRPIS